MDAEIGVGGSMVTIGCSNWNIGGNDEGSNVTLLVGDNESSRCCMSSWSSILPEFGLEVSGIHLLGLLDLFLGIV